MTLKIKSSTFEIASETLPCIWGQINYWDIERSNWHDTLKSYAALGNKILSTAILPSAHEIAPGQYDFGQLRPQLDIAAFCDEAHQLGLKVILWLGPRVVPGMGGAGYPSAALSNPEIAARDQHGRYLLSRPGFNNDCFTLPSLLHPVLGQILNDFAAKLHPYLTARTHPDGPVIAAGLTQAPGWETAIEAGWADYHPNVQKHFQDFLKRRYHTLAKLNEMYAASFASFKEIPLPCAPGADSVRDLDWARFQEEYFILAAEMVHRAFEGICVKSLPLLLSSIPCGNRPFNVTELDRLRCFDLVVPGGLEHESSALPLGSRLGISNLLLYGKALLHDSCPSFAVRAENRPEAHLDLLLHEGVRGIEALAPAGAGPLRGFLINRQGQLHSEPLRSWAQWNLMARTDGFWQSQPYASVLLFSQADEERRGYLRRASFPRADVLQAVWSGQVGASQPPLDPYRIAFEETADFLSAQQYPTLMASSDMPIQRLPAGAVLVVPVAGFLEAGLISRLDECLEAGFHVILCGRLPKLTPQDPLLQWLDAKPQRRTKSAAGKKKAGRGPISLVECVGSELLSTLQKYGATRLLQMEPSPANVRYHRWRNRFFVTMQNPTTAGLRVTVRRDGKFVLKDFFNRHKFFGGNGEMSLDLGPGTIHFWELIVC